MTKGHSMAYWTPGPGVGGHCLPIDPMYLAWQTRALLGRPFRLAELADEINGGRPARVVERRSSSSTTVDWRCAAPRSSCSASPTSRTSAT